MDTKEHELDEDVYRRSARLRGPCRLFAFSLIEVVIAVAIFAGAVTVLLGLLASSLRDSADAADAQTALRLPGAVEVVLREIAAREGLPTLAARIPVMDASADRGYPLAATRDGEFVRLADAAPDGTLLRSEYYLIDVRRFASGPLAYAAGRTVLPLQIRVSWPYRVLTPEGLTAPVPFEQRRHVTFNLGLTP